MEPPVKPRLIIVFYSLPVVLNSTLIEMGFLEREFNSTLSAVKALKKNNVISDCVWVGCPHRLQEEEPDGDVLSEGAHFVNISPQLFEEFVSGFVKGVLWPLFHSHIKEVKFEERLWRSYQQANEAFASVIADIHQPGDIIWIHGSALMLLPQLVRDKIPDAAIGFFLHAAFPSFEVFRILPPRQQLLEGLLGANLIGFQTYTTASEFLQTSTHILGQDATLRDITLPNGHTARVDVYPIGIDPTEILETLAQPEVQKRAAEFQKTFSEKKLIIARDRAEKNNGVIQKLLAVESLLTNYPEWQGKLVYLQICEPVNTSSTMELTVSSQVNELVGRINGRFGRVGYVPVELHNRNIKKEEMCTLYRAADVALITPLRAGMNTDVHDYITCRNYTTNELNNSGNIPCRVYTTSELTTSGNIVINNNSTNNDELPDEVGGVVVISEFAGSARCFGGALIVNPYSKTEVATALNEALTMADDERALKHSYNWNYVKSHTSFSWAEAFVSDLSTTVKRRLDHDPVPRLDVTALKNAYATSNKRLFLLDYDGTLTPIVRDPSMAVPSHRVLQILTKLASDSKNVVYVVSGRDKDVLEKWLSDLKNVGLCCEHGSFIRHINKDWESDDNLVIEWRDPVLNLMKYFRERTPGSFIEEKRTSIAWHYRNVDPQYSISQAQELMSHLKAVSSKYAVDVLWGNKVIEARPSGVNKSGAVKKILAEHGEPDFIFCIGDDKTDEDMFATVDKTHANYFTVAVKKKPTQAKAYVRDQKDVLVVLEAMAGL